MAWIDEALARLSDTPCCGYTPDALPAVEPTALAAMALLQFDRVEPATLALRWLAETQSNDGSLGISAAQKTPCWPAGWAVLAWRMRATDSASTDAADRAIAWIVSFRAKAAVQTSGLGHNTRLQAWPWVAGTHGWVEPTAINLMAMKRSGQADHPRCREAVAVLVDRMLPSGGWNYGNKVVLGNTLRPHVQPTGLALAALRGEPAAAQACAESLAYVQQTLSDRTTTASLCYALMGAAMHGRRPPAADRWLEAAYHRTLQRDASPYKLSLLVLAASGRPCPWYALNEVTR